MSRNLWLLFTIPMTTTYPQKTKPCRDIDALNDEMKATAHLEDSKLISDGLQGDRNAFEILFSRYRPILYRLAQRILHNHEESEDAVQNCSLVAFRKMESFKYEGAFRSWLARMLVNEAITILRKRKRTHSSECLISQERAEAADLLPDPGPNPEQILFQKQSANALMRKLSQLTEIAEGGFREEELCGQDFTGGVVLHTESSEPRPAAFEPIVGAAVELHKFAEPCRTHATLAMSGSSAFSRRVETVLAQQAAQGFTAERKALALDQLLAEMVIVEADIGAARKLDDTLDHGLGQATVTGPSAVGVSQSRLPVCAHTLLQAFHVARSDIGVRRLWHTPCLP